MLDPPIDDDADAVRSALAPLRSRLSIALYRFGNAFAIGAAIRVAHSFLVDEILLIGDAPFYPKGSMGMEKYERIVPLRDDEALFAHVGARPVWAVEKAAGAQDLYQVATIPEDVVLLFGSERFGVPTATLARAAATVALPMYGVNHSFPVAVTVGMVLGEWGRRHYAPGSLHPRPRRREPV